MGFSGGSITPGQFVRLRRGLAWRVREVQRERRVVRPIQSTRILFATRYYRGFVPNTIARMKNVGVVASFRDVLQERKLRRENKLGDEQILFLENR